MMFFWSSLLTLLVGVCEGKLQKMQELRGQDGLVRMSEIAEYREYALKSPKPYEVFVMFTSDPKFCRVCKAYERVFEHVAVSFMRASDEGEHSNKTPVFFLLIDLSVMPQAVQLHGIKHMPVIVHLDRQTALVKRKTGELQFRDRDQFPINKLDPAASELLDWANGQSSSRSVRLFFTMGERIQHALFVLCVLAGVAMAGVGLVLQCRKRRWLVATLPVLIQYVATSGIVFNLLNGMMMKGPDGAFILRSPRGQYLGEGLTMSGLMVGGGLCLLLGVRLPWLVPETFRLQRETLLAVVTVFLTTAAVAAVMVMLNVYRLKTGWYQDPPFFPPAWYKRGPVRVDQGNAF